MAQWQTRKMAPARPRSQHRVLGSIDTENGNLANALLLNNVCTLEAGDYREPDDDKNAWTITCGGRPGLKIILARTRYAPSRWTPASTRR